MREGFRAGLLAAALLSVGFAATPASAQERFRGMGPQALIQSWPDAKREERFQILDGLLQQRGVSVLALRSTAITGRAEDRVFAVRMLTEMRDSGGLATLRAALDDPDDRVRKHAVIASRRLGDAAALPRLRQLLNENVDRGTLKVTMASIGALGTASDRPRLRPFLNDADETVRVMAAGSLAMLGSVEGENVLLDAVDGDNPVAQKNATIALGYLGTPEATARIQEILDDPDGRWKSYALVAQADQQLALASLTTQAYELGRLAGQGQSRILSEWAFDRLADLNTPEATAAVAKLANRGGLLGVRARHRLALMEGR